MSAQIIDGKAIADQIRKAIAQQVEQLREKGLHPGLGFILVGDDPGSHAYVRMKRKACEQVGFHSRVQSLPREISQSELLTVIREFNQDSTIHGFLVQHPLPKQINVAQISEAVDLAKDVDCFHPYNVGLMADSRELFLPCTPAGIVELLQRSRIAISGKHVVIVGRSAIVGRPLALLLSRKGQNGDATVTLCHSRTPDLGYFTRQADILVAAIGQPEFIHGDKIKPGAVVIDVGANRLEVAKPNAAMESKLVGDVHFPSVVRKAYAITPVPGGVGPMTIAMLLRNTLLAAQRSVKDRG
ncbi:MAG: tetrahydrofolate dehydrogenase/cyclohydrolase catalytic domain-containing protein [bacterium]